MLAILVQTLTQRQSSLNENAKEGDDGIGALRWMAPEGTSLGHHTTFALSHGFRSIRTASPLASDGRLQLRVIAVGAARL